MKVDYLSDLHVNHHVPFTTNQLKWERWTKEWTEKLLSKTSGDVLVVAGDFSEWNAQSLWFLEEASQHYRHVFFVLGNHDYYLLSKSQKKKYRDSKGRVDEFLEAASKLARVSPLDRRVVAFEGVTFAGDTLWYDLSSESAREFYFEKSNDSRLIQLPGQTEAGGVSSLNKEGLGWYSSLKETPVDVMVSHVPPVLEGTKKKLSSCYEVAVPFFVGKHWVCGHQHVRKSWTSQHTEVHMHPLGYPSEQLSLSVGQFTM